MWILDPKQALALALAINELATNASKYGALSEPTGTVDVSWSVTKPVTSPAFVFVWRETGGPAVVAPSREGFGTRVIKTSLADDFGGTVELAYEPAGFVCTLTAPLENLPGASIVVVRRQRQRKGLLRNSCACATAERRVVIRSPRRR